MHAASAPKSYGENARRSSAVAQDFARPPGESRCSCAWRPAGSRANRCRSWPVCSGSSTCSYIRSRATLCWPGPPGTGRQAMRICIVSTDSGQPVVRLDDLVVVFRQMMGGRDASFGCLIVPRQESLARFQEFVNESNKKPIRPEDRKAWLGSLRSQLGKQDIEVNGLDPRTRAARVMVEADYHMKLVGMGLAEGVPGVRSYLDLVKIRPGEAPPPMGVLRWWFTLELRCRSGGKRSLGICHKRTRSEGPQRKRTAFGGRQADSHGRVGCLDPAVRPKFHGELRGPGDQVSRFTGN